MQTTNARAGETPRAFDILTHVPAGCRLLPVLSDFAEPHLRPGEFAIIAPIAASTHLADGMAVAKRMLSGRHEYWQLKRYAPGHGPFGPEKPAAGARPEIVFGLRPLLPNTADDVERWRGGEKLRVRLSDGWLDESALRPLLIGQVIGVLAATAHLTVRGAGRHRIARGGAA